MGAIKETFFISHGSPTLSIDESLAARHFLQAFRETVFSQRPKAILVISAHWDTSEPSVNTIHGRHDTIHDFYGFPKPMYKVLSCSLLYLFVSFHSLCLILRYIYTNRHTQHVEAFVHSSVWHVHVVYICSSLIW